MIDGHMHLENGPLTVEYAMKFIEAGIEKGMDTIQILDHTHRFIEWEPIYDGVKAAAFQQKEWLEKKKLEPLSTYHELIEEIKAMDLPIEVKFGLEVCYVPEYEDKIRELINLYPYDYVIGSIHSIDGLLYDMNAFSREILWDVYDHDYIYKRYYEIMEQMITSDLFTQIGHPDTIKLFNIYPSYDLTPTYIKIAKLAKQHDVYMENNTGCYYRYKHKDMGLSDEFLAILKEYGCKIMTASDAHVPEHVGMYIKEITNK